MITPSISPEDLIIRRHMARKYVDVNLIKRIQVPVDLSAVRERVASVKEKYYTGHVLVFYPTLSVEESIRVPLVNTYFSVGFSDETITLPSERRMKALRDEIESEDAQKIDQLYGLLRTYGGPSGRLDFFTQGRMRVVNRFENRLEVIVNNTQLKYGKERTISSGDWFKVGPTLLFAYYRIGSLHVNPKEKSSGYVLELSAQ